MHAVTQIPIHKTTNEESKTMITETLIVEVATVAVSDEYRVELWRFTKLTDYSPEQAEELANALMLSAAEPRSMLGEHLIHVAASAIERGPITATALL